jgi:predicted phosphate transport protein (TIGR00153 family)
VSESYSAATTPLLLVLGKNSQKGLIHCIKLNELPLTRFLKLYDDIQNQAYTRELIKEIEDMEHLNDDYTHQIFTELGKNFITPFDREDIHYLATALDDIADYMYASAKKINFYHVNPNDEGIRKMADLITLGCNHVHNAVVELRDMKNMRKITDALVAINNIENQADHVFDMSIENLFAKEPDAKEVIKKREIYQVMEIVTDKCEDVANVIESIIIKYA